MTRDVPPPEQPPDAPSANVSEPSDALVALSSQDGVGSPHGYPRPQFRRKVWYCLDGEWEFALDPQARFRVPSDVRFDRRINVPFAPETKRSGVAHTGYFMACWYRRHLRAPDLASDQRLILHFGAVDHRATVWFEGIRVAEHEGGYTPFSVDLTDLVRPGVAQELVVRAFDDPEDLSKPRGKQDWELEPHSIWYPRTSGIWQTVWIEVVPAARIRSARWVANLERWEIAMLAHFDTADRKDLRLTVKMRARGQLIADDTYRVVGDEVNRRISFSDPGIDDSRNGLLWSPHQPVLIDVELELWAGRGQLLDTVQSYTALRSVGIEGDRLLLNGRPNPLRLVLDQGYWPDTGMTAPSDEALRRDVELARAMGFNGVRKHQKVEDPRYLYWADRLGLLVWEEMPSAYRFTRESIERVTREWLEVLSRDSSHPCIIAWVPFNESWGVPNLPESHVERHYVQALYHLTKTLDPSRPVVGNDGWEIVATDLIGIHDYDPDPESIARRYHADHVRPRLLRRERPGGRVITLSTFKEQDHPIVLSEFGGVALRGEGTWGYSDCSSPEDLGRRYRALMSTIHKLEVLCGFCYTQFADTYQEANGLLYADRTPKFPLLAMARATSGRDRPGSDSDLDLEPSS